MPSPTSIPEPDELDLVAWWAESTADRAAALRGKVSSADWAATLEAARLSWEREGKPALPILDPKALL